VQLEGFLTPARSVRYSYWKLTLPAPFTVLLCPACVQHERTSLRNLALLLLCCVCVPLNSFAAHSSGHHSFPSHLSYRTRSGHHGRYKRSTAAKNEFKREYPCPATGRSSGRLGT
jgi:hypothetical protein